ncbi:MAG: hypothetical protein ACRD1K_00290 [Acidimicrobiales bacterium]
MRGLVVRLTTGLMVAGSVVVGWASASEAQVPSVTINPPSAAVGEVVEVSGRRFSFGGNPVEVRLDPPGGPVVATVAPDEQGSFSIAFAVARVPAGNHILRATQTDAGGAAVPGTPTRTILTVTGPAPPPPTTPTTVPPTTEPPPPPPTAPAPPPTATAPSIATPRSGSTPTSTTTSTTATTLASTTTSVVFETPAVVADGGSVPAPVLTALAAPTALPAAPPDGAAGPGAPSGRRGWVLPTLLVVGAAAVVAGARRRLRR